MKQYLNDDNINKIIELSKNDEDVELYEKIIKLQEEVGEVAAAFLALNLSYNASNSAKSNSIPELYKNLVEEIVDSTIVCMDLLNAFDGSKLITEEYIDELFSNKLKKWEFKQ